MTDFYNRETKEAVKLNQQATEAFEQGMVAGQHSDEYIRVTVTLATVLLLMAISQRFKIHVVRVALTTIAAFLLCLPLYRIFTLPRAQDPV